MNKLRTAQLVAELMKATRTAWLDRSQLCGILSCYEHTIARNTRILIAYGILEEREVAPKHGPFKRKQYRLHPNFGGIAGDFS